MVDNTHAKRIKTELVAVGVSKYGLLKSESRYLPQIIQPNEHIKAVAYGQHNNSSAMLVATDERIIYLDKKPTVVIRDEFMYSAVTGIEFDIHTLFATVVLQTTVGNYVMRYSNIVCAEKFAKLIDKKMKEIAQSDTKSEKDKSSTISKSANAKWLKFLKDNNVGVLSSVGRNGQVRGATIHYMIRGIEVYIVTKAGTQKVHNILVHKQVCLSVFNKDSMQTLQLFGNAEVLSDVDLTHEIVALMIKPRNYGGEILPPPITRLDASSYVVLRIIPSSHEYADYKS